MGCPKHLYHQNHEHEPTLFIGLWKKEAQKESETQFYEILGEKRGQQKKCVNYYPFGLTFNSSADSPENLYKYNGFEEQKETGWYHFRARFHDPELGRFTTIDPKASSFYYQSPYAYAANNPVLFHEKNGENPIWGAIIGGGIGAAVGVISAGINSGWDGEAMKRGAISGFVGGAIGGAIVGSFGTLSGLSGVGAGILGGTIDGAVSNATDQMLSNYDSGQPISNIDASQVIISGAIGGVTGGAVAPIANGASKVVSKAIGEGKERVIDAGVESYIEYERNIGTKTGTAALDRMVSQFKGAAALELRKNGVENTITVGGTILSSSSAAVGNNVFNAPGVVSSVNRDYDNNSFTFSATRTLDDGSTQHIDYTTDSSDDFDEYLNAIGYTEK